MVEISKRFLDQCQMKDSQCFKFTLGREPFKFINSYSKKQLQTCAKYSIVTKSGIQLPRHTKTSQRFLSERSSSNSSLKGCNSVTGVFIFSG
jgi:hypothetical protein